MKVLRIAESFDLEPQLPRQRKRPRRYEEGEADSEFHTDPKAYFRQLYYEAVDLTVSSIKDRFQQPGYEVYSKLEQLLLKSCQGQDVTTELDFLCKFYKDDIQPEVLQAHTLTFGLEFQRANGNHDKEITLGMFDINKGVLQFFNHCS